MGESFQPFCAIPNRKARLIVSQRSAMSGQLLLRDGISDSDLDMRSRKEKGDVVPGPIFSQQSLHQLHSTQNIDHGEVPSSSGPI